MLIDTEGKNSCLFVIAKMEIAAVGWNVKEIERFDQQSESFSKLMGLLMRIYTSYIDEGFLEYADSELHGIPISVTGRIGSDCIDFKFDLMGDFIDVFHLEKREVRPLWEYISEYNYDEDADSLVAEDYTDDDECGDDCSAEYMSDDYEFATQCLVYFETLNDIMICCGVLHGQKHDACQSSLIKTSDGRYALHCRFSNVVEDSTLTTFDNVFLEFSSKLEYDDARIACICEHATYVINEDAIAKLNEVLK